MSKRLRIIISGACALVALSLCYLYANRVRQEAENLRAETLARYGGELVDLVVSTKELHAGDVIDPEDLAIKNWLADLAPEGAYVDLDKVVGQTVTGSVAKGAAITEADLRDWGSEQSIPAGMVAISIPLSDNTGINSNVVAGSRIAAYEVSKNHVRPLAANLLVVSDGQAKSAPRNQRSITIAAEPSKVSLLLRCSAEGSLRLVLPADDVEALDAPEADPLREVPQSSEQKSSEAESQPTKEVLADA